jgi:hypothetical protein
LVSKSNRQFGLVKATTPELAQLLGVDINDSVLIIPVTELLPLLNTEAQASKERDTQVAAAAVADLELPSFSNLTPGEAKIMAALKKLGRSARGPIMSVAKISPEIWTKAISSLKNSGLVTQLGERRSATYVLTKDAPETQQPEAPEESVEERMKKLFDDDEEFDTAPAVQTAATLDIGKPYNPKPSQDDEGEDEVDESGVPSGYVEEPEEPLDDGFDGEDDEPVGLDEGDEDITEEPSNPTPIGDRMDRHMNNELPITESKPAPAAQPEPQVEW